MVDGAVVAVIGSLNIDFITVTPRIAEGGESLTASSFTTGFGGKGANQAVASARLSSRQQGTQTLMVGNVGDDHFGKDYIEVLSHEGIGTSGITVCQGEKTGIANIIVEEQTGENRIYFAPNANYSQAEQSGNSFPSNATVAVFQLEMPLNRVMQNIEAADKIGAYTILNPAPAIKLAESIYSHVDCIILNETEASIICDGQDQPWDTFFFAKGLRHLVILTQGSRGVSWATKQDSGKSTVQSIAARKVKVVDTTAAGDTFVGAFASRIAERKDRKEDVRALIEFANDAAAMTVTKAGAMSAIPTVEDLTDWLRLPA